MLDPSRTLDVFSVLGAPVDLRSRARFVFHLVRQWPTPSFSPLMLRPGERLTAADLDVIFQFFAAHPTNAHVKQTPYFNLFTSEPYDRADIDAVCAGAGWAREEQPLAIKFMGEPSPVDLPGGFSASTHDFSAGGLTEDYRRLLGVCFDADDRYLRHVDMTFADADARTLTTLIWSAAGALVAGGTVSVKGELGFFTWGAVAPEFRGAGFHRALLSACHVTARRHGARTSALTTRNALVRSDWDAVVEVDIYRREVA